MKKIELWVYASAALMIIGAFGPWVTAQGLSISGTGGKTDGWIVVGAAALAALAYYERESHRAREIWAAIFGGAAVAVTFYDRMNLQNSVNAGGLPGFVSVGWGLNLALLASASLIVAALVSRSQTDTQGAADQLAAPEQ